MVNRIPKYRRQKRSNGDIAFVELNGQRHYLGAYGTAKSKQKYHHLLVEWTTAGGQLPVPKEEITIMELLARFLSYAQKHYRRPDGSPTSEINNFKIALKPLKELYGLLPVCDFSPLKLKAVRQQLIAKRLTRKSINKMVGRIRTVIRWGTENELVPPEVIHGLQAVSGLQQGRTEAKESGLVKPVPQAHIAAIESHVNRQIWSLVQLQLHTAARAGELVKIRAIDIDTSGKIWTYTPADHKTAHHGHSRTIYIGPQGQETIRQFMRGRPVDAYLFSPREADAERYRQANTHRRLNQKANPRKTHRVVGNHYTTASYRRAIERACKLADVPAWTPHRLRHNAGTYIRKEFGVEAAQIMLGHKKADVTQIYPEVNRDKALEIAAQIG